MGTRRNPVEEGSSIGGDHNSIFGVLALEETSARKCGPWVGRRNKHSVRKARTIGPRKEKAPHCIGRDGGFWGGS